MTFLKRYSFGAVGFNFLIAAFGLQWALLMQGWFHSLDYTDGKIKIGVERFSIFISTNPDFNVTYLIRIFLRINKWVWVMTANPNSVWFCADRNTKNQACCHIWAETCFHWGVCTDLSSVVRTVLGVSSKTSSHTQLYLQKSNHLNNVTHPVYLIWRHFSMVLDAITRWGLLLDSGRSLEVKHERWSKTSLAVLTNV